MTTERPVPLSTTDAAYVHSGRVPLAYGGLAPADVERAIVATMVRGRWTRDAAWTTVRAAHPRAFPTMRSHPEGFAEHWSRADGSGEATREGPAHALRIRPANVAPFLGAAITQVWRRLGRIPRRARPRAVHVALAVVARCAAEGSLRVRVPLRSLQLATGMRSRGAVVEGLREAASLLGCLHASFDPRVPLESSHELEVVVDPAGVAGGPLGFTHPLLALWAGSRHGTPDWVGLPGDAPLVWAALLCSGGRGSRGELANLVSAGEASRQTRRTVDRVLAAMAAAGLVVLRDEDVALGEDHRTDAGGDLARRIVEERRWWAFRCHAFELNRQDRARERLERQRAWWHGLPEPERAGRREERRAWFAGLPCVEQDRYRDLWSRQRRRAGITVRHAHQSWCEAHVTVERRRTRRAWYGTQPPTRQAELRASWARWRLAHGVARFRSNSAEESPPPTRLDPPPVLWPLWPAPGWTNEDHLKRVASGLLIQGSPVGDGDGVGAAVVHR